MKITLQPGERRPIPSQGKYLIVRSAEKPFQIQDPASGMPETEVRAADNVELANVRTLYAINPHDVPVVIDVQVSAFPVRTNDGGSVTLAGGSIDRINESISVTASATVENGTMHVISGAAVTDHADKTINGSQKVKIAGLNPNRKGLLIQVISDTKTVLRIGGASVAAGRGALVVGSMAAPGSMPVETAAELWAFNESTDPATVAVLEVLK